MTLRPSTAPKRVPLPSPPASSLPDNPDLESDSLRAASPTVTRFLATAVTDPLFESSAASALVAELVDFAAACRLDYATSLVAESASVSICPPSVGGECALGTDVLEDRQEDLECFAAAVPHLVSMLLAPEGDPDALDIPTPCSYAEAIEGPYSSQWQAAMGAEMASWKSTGTYVDEVPPPGANIVSGMWIFRVKRPPGSPPAFKARYVARGFSQRQEVDFFHTFSPTPKMTTLRVLLHVAAQRDYELHSLDFSTAFLQGSLHEEIWLRRPPGFTGLLPAGTQWSLQRPVYGLRQAPREWHDTLRTTLAALGFSPSTADPSLFLRTDASLPPFYVLVHVDDLVFATADTEALAHVKSELQKRHTCTDLGPSALRLHVLLATVHSSTYRSRALSSTFGRVLHRAWGSCLEDELELSSLELRWLTYLLTDLGEVPRSPPVLYVDNKAMLALCQEHRLEHRTKHIALRYFLARELQQRGQLRLAYVASQANTADVFTKTLQPFDHQPCFVFLDWSCDPLFSPTLPMGALYDAVVARYSSRATVALGCLLLPYLFPELSALAIVEDLVSHLCTSVARYRAAVPAEDHFLSLDPTSLTFDLLEQHLLAAETSAVAVGAARGTPRPPFFEGCSPSPLAPSYASAATADVSVAEDVGAASASAKRRSGKGKGGKGGGGGSGGGGGGSGRSGGGSSGGGGGGGTGGGSGGSGGGGGGSGGSGGGGGSGTSGGGTGAWCVGSGGGHHQQQQRRSETQSPQQLREWFLRGASGGSCPYVIRTGDRAGQTCGRLHTQHRFFSRLDNAWHAEFGDDVELPCWADLLSAEGDCYQCVPPDPGIAATALGASESGTLPGIAPAQALHTFTLDSGASACFFRDSTTLTPLSTPVPVRLADPSGGPVVARSSSVLPCSAVPSGSLSGLHLPLFSANLVSTAALQDAMVTTTTPGGQVAASCSCRLLSHQTLLWQHRLGHPSLPRLRGMQSHLLVSGLPGSLPPLPPFPSPPCLPCVEGRKRAAPHSSFPPTTAPLQTLHMDVIFLSCVCTLIEVLSIGLVMEVARTSMIHAAAPHFLWPFAVRYAAQQLNLWPRVSLPETSPTLCWTGEVGDASVFWVWGSRAFLRDTSADKLSPRAFPCVFLGFVPDAPGWQFYHPTLRRVFPTQDVTFDESVPFYRLFPYRSAPPSPPPLFLALGPPPLDPLPPQGPAPSGVSQVHPLPGPAPVQVAVGSDAARSAVSRGAASGGAEPGGAESEGAETGGGEPGGGEPGGAEPQGVEPGGCGVWRC
ncbi:unnamed protein product [Closterium sp. NIES-53]